MFERSEFTIFCVMSKINRIFVGSGAVFFVTFFICIKKVKPYSTVTDLAKFLGLSTSFPLATDT